MHRNTFPIAGLFAGLLQGQGLDEGAAQRREALLRLMQTPVEASSRYAQGLMDSPQATAVLTRDDLDRLGPLSLVELLRGLPGVDAHELGTLGDTAGLRGSLVQGAPNTVQILVDGAPLHNPVAGVLSLSLIPVPWELIDRIEVTRGPSSTLHGANAVTGVISIRTRRAGSGSEGRLRAEALRPRGARGGGALRLGGEAWGFVAGAEGLSVDDSGHRYEVLGAPPPAIRPTEAQLDATSRDARRKQRAFLRGDMARGAHQAWFSAGAAHLHAGPAFVGAIFTVPYALSDSNVLQAGWTWRPSSTLVTEAQLNRVYFRQGIGPVPALASADPATVGESYPYEYHREQGSLLLNWRATPSLRFVGGLDGARLQARPSPLIGLLETSRERSAGLFAAMDLSLPGDLGLSLGARAERETLGGSRISPRAVLTWKPTGRSHLRAGWFTSTRSPQVYESRVNSNLGPLRILPNPDLDPESLATFELGYRWSDGAWSLDATAFRGELRHEILRLPVAGAAAGTNQYQNGPSYPSRGLEGEVTWWPHAGWVLGLNATVLHVEDGLTGEQADYAAPFRANLWTRFTHGAWLGGLTLHHTARTRVGAYQGAIVRTDREAFTRLNAHLAWTLVRGLQIFATGELLGAPFTPQGTGFTTKPFVMYGGTRRVGLGMTWRF